MRKFKLLCVFLFCVVAALPAAAEDSAALQFTVAAPDPVMAGEEVKLQTLVVNTGSAAWLKGTYYWAAEIYNLEGDERKFLAQTETLTPVEDVAPGTAHGVQIPFTVPDTMQWRRLLYRVFLIKDGKRILETEYKGFQVIEKELRPPPPQDFKMGGDITLSYKNSSPDGWNNHQAITSANIVGKVKKSSFLFNTYIVHTYHRPITPSIVLLNYYAPWGNLSLGDISPSLTPLSMESQGMRGVSYERNSGRLALTALIGRIVAPQEPGTFSAGRFSRFTGGVKGNWQFSPTFRVTADAVLSRDDQFSINISTPTSTLKPKDNLVYGLNAEWKFMRFFTFTSEYQLSTYDDDLNTSTGTVSAAAWKQELKYKGALFTARAALSRIAPDYFSLASPGVIADRMTLDGELGFFPTDWETFTLGYTGYGDNLESDPSRTTTSQAQTTLTNTLRIMGKTTVSVSYITNATKGEPATVQDNKTTTMGFSVTQPWAAHTLNLGYQLTGFKDNTGLSNDLDTALVSFNGSFRLNSRLMTSVGLVNSATVDKADPVLGGTDITTENNTLTGNFSYSIPRKAMAYQFWTTLSTSKNDSSLSAVDSSSLSLNLETVWLKSQSSRFTFGVGMISRTDNLNSAADSTQYNCLTRYNYSF